MLYSKICDMINLYSYVGKRKCYIHLNYQKCFQEILSFTPDHVRAICHKIFELIPCLESHPEWCFDECWGDVKE